jgi:hypothetical protein
MHDAALAAYQLCLDAKGPPGIVWDSETGQTLWEDEVYDVHRPVDFWSDAAIAQSARKTIHQIWCRAKAKEYLAAHGLKVDEDDQTKVAKAIGAGAQQAVLALKRHANFDFLADATAWQIWSVPTSASDSRPPQKVMFQALLEGWPCRRGSSHAGRYAAVEGVAARGGAADEDH